MLAFLMPAEVRRNLMLPRVAIIGCPTGASTGSCADLGSEGAGVTSLYEEHADLYDLAFDWDVSDEAAWLLERLGPSCRSILEPGCGSGRILDALAKLAEVEVVGIDRSPAMVAAARRRLDASGVEGIVILADMTSFDIGRPFDGAVCPINTLGHLLPRDLERHLACIGRHLREDARYLVQLGLLGDDGTIDDQPPSEWEMTEGDTSLRITWSTDEIDLAARRQGQRSRIEILSGGRAGEVHTMSVWTPETWAATVAASSFVQTATYDGDVEGHPPVEAGRVGPLLWHELTRDT
jgi:SAM-dependent methyltransferase